ncbi:unnamed protein product [Cuscuta campestris]|uniref:Uncharacterized protein n=1 Tax=Cuscuta campestris TaxID=132261 RepID=A0A484LI87_9ASTE|nr:unnamed protein product [Cuscuta campestris]
MGFGHQRIWTSQVCDMGAARSIVLSLPIASGLALLSTVMASTMVSKSYIWAYATFQFAGVLLFTYIFYTMLNVSAILSILLSAFTGFGITFSANSLLVEYSKWRSTRRIQVCDMGVARSIVWSLPISSGLALLSTIMASTMVSKSYIWAYATFQFAGVLLFTYIFYTVLNVSAILSILLSTFTGFGITFSANSLLVEYLKWRSTRRIQEWHYTVSRLTLSI